MSNSAGEPSHAFQLLPRDILLLTTFQIGNIGAAADIAGELTVRSEARNAAAKNPPELPVGAPQTMFLLEGAAVVERGRVRIDAALEIVRMNRGGPAVAQLLLQSAAGEGEPAPVDERTALVGSGHPDHQRRGVGQVAESFFAFAPRRVGPQGAEFSDIRAHNGKAGRAACRVA